MKICRKIQEIVKREILNDSKSDVASKRAGVTVDDIYDWYYKGKSDEEFREFSEFFYNHYIEHNVLWVNRMLKEGLSLEKILSEFTENFTSKDFEIWQEDGLIEKENIFVDLTEDDEEENLSLFENYQYGENSSDNKLTFDSKNSDLYSYMNKDDEEEITTKDVFFKQKNSSKSSTILKKDEKDIEKLKKEILGNKGD